MIVYFSRSVYVFICYVDTNVNESMVFDLVAYNSITHVLKQLMNSSGFYSALISIIYYSN